MQDTIQYPLLNDTVFKYVFSHKEIQEDFLNLFWEFIKDQEEQQKVVDIHAQELLMAPNYNLRDYYGDIIAALSDETIVSLEAFNRFGENAYKKSLCYVARIYGNQLKTNEPYSKALGVVGITLFRKKNKYNMENVIEEYKLAEQIEKVKISEAMTLYLMDLDKAEKFTYNKDGRFKDYIKVMNMRWLKDMEEYVQDKEGEMVNRAVAYVKEFLSDPNNQNLIDHQAIEVENAKEEGINETKMQTAKKMLSKGMDLELTAEITGLSLNEIESIVV